MLARRYTIAGAVVVAIVAAVVVGAIVLASSERVVDPGPPRITVGPLQFPPSKPVTAEPMKSDWSWSSPDGRVVFAQETEGGVLVMHGTRQGTSTSFVDSQGTTRWTRDDLFLSGFPLAPQDEDTMVLSSISGERAPITGVDVRTGEMVWQRDLVGLLLADLGDRVLVQPNGADSLMAVEIATGRMRWETDLDGISINSGRVYGIDSAADELVALDAVNGQELWRVEVFDESNTAVVDDVVVVHERDKITALDVLDGGERWTEEIDVDAVVDFMATIRFGLGAAVLRDGEPLFFDRDGLTTTGAELTGALEGGVEGSVLARVGTDRELFQAGTKVFDESGNLVAETSDPARLELVSAGVYEIDPVDTSTVTYSDDTGEVLWRKDFGRSLVFTQADAAIYVAKGRELTRYE